MAAVLVQLVPKYSTNTDCTSILFSDQTPWYNAVTAPTGYDDSGVNSTDPDDVNTNAAYLDITPLSTGTKYTVQIPDINFDKTEIGKSGFTTASIPASTFGASTIPDGIYKVTYRFTLLSNGRKVSVTNYIACTCAIDCCINEQLLTLGCCSDCSDEKNNRKIYNLYRAHMLRDKIKYQLACNDAQGAQNTINCLTEFCNITTCNSCGNR